MKIFGVFLGTKLLALKIFGRSTECVGLKILGAFQSSSNSLLGPTEGGVFVHRRRCEFSLFSRHHVPSNIHSAPSISSIHYCTNYTLLRS